MSTRSTRSSSPPKVASTCPRTASLAPSTSAARNRACPLSSPPPAAQRAVATPVRRPWRADVKAVVLGGTSGMGRALGQRLAELGHEVFLMGIDAEQLARSAADLKARDPEQRDVGHAVCDLEHPEQFESALDGADAALRGFDTVIVTAGMFASQERLEADTELARRLVTVNYANTVAFCEHARKRLLSRGGGKLVVFSSVAGDRGRKPVAIYGSSKAGLSAYLEALDHKFHDQGLTVV